MGSDLLWVLGENQISKARPLGCILASCSLTLAGAIVVLASIPVMLGVLFASVQAAIIPAMVIALAGLCFPLSWGLYRGHLWAWCGAVLVSALLIALAWWFESHWASRWSEALLLLLIGNQIMLWWGNVRAWLFESHRLRAHGYADVTLPGGKKTDMPEV